MSDKHKALATETTCSLDGPRYSRFRFVDSPVDFGIDDCETVEQAWARLNPDTPMPDLTWKREQ